MDEAFELAPSDDERVISARSPTLSPPIPSSLLKERKNNDSQESLFYSSSTCREDFTHRSPRFINLPILESQKPKIKIEGQKSLKERVTEKVSRSNHNTQKENRHKLQKKTKRIEQLQEALEAQTLLVEQLRSRMNVMTQLVQKGFQKTQLVEFLKCRNSSKKLSHIDIFIELQFLREQSEQLRIHIHQLKHENQLLKQSTSQLQFELTNKEYLTKERITLIQQNQSLSSYVQEFQKKYRDLLEENDKNIALIKILQNNTNSQSSSRYQLQQNMRSTQKQIEILNKQIQKIKEEYQMKLQCLQLQHESTLHQKDEEINKVKQSLECAQKKLSLALGIGPKKQDYQRIKWQLQNCRKQRQYYHQQYLGKLNQSTELHETKLKHKSEVDYLRQKIRKKEEQERRKMVAI